ncbi:hypothetical protein E4T47_05199 [Aureobasidium subglaciale]|nr:hypothetical protein E4T47_05199 [Aureobasidium subglaciale]
MGISTRKKVGEEPGLDAPNFTTTESATANHTTGISRFGRANKTDGAQSSRSGTGRLVSKAMRIVQFLLAVLILGLVAYALHVYSATLLQSAYIPALIAAILTILATIPLAFLSRVPGFSSHPLSAVLIDLSFALFWLAIMAELAAYSDVTRPRDLTYYTGRVGQQVNSNAAYAAYSDTLNRLRRAWSCGAAAAAFAGIEFVLFLISALLPLRGRLVGPAAGSDSTGVPTNHHGSARHSGAGTSFEMRTRNAGHTGPASPTSPAAMHGLSNPDGQALGHGNTDMLGSAIRNTFVPTPPGQHEGVTGMGDRGNMI